MFVETMLAGTLLSVPNSAGLTLGHGGVAQTFAIRLGHHQVLVQLPRVAPICELDDNEGAADGSALLQMVLDGALPEDWLDEEDRTPAATSTPAPSETGIDFEPHEMPAPAAQTAFADAQVDDEDEDTIVEDESAYVVKSGTSDAATADPSTASASADDSVAIPADSAGSDSISSDSVSSDSVSSDSVRADSANSDSAGADSAESDPSEAPDEVEPADVQPAASPAHLDSVPDRPDLPEDQPSSVTSPVASPALASQASDPPSRAGT